MEATSYYNLPRHNLRPVAVMRGREISVRRVLGAVILIELCVLYLVLKESSWAYDDNFFLVLAGQEGFTWHWLTSVQFEHWDIGEHVLLSLQHRLFFFDYRWALVAMLMALGASMYLFERILATVVKRRWITVTFAAWFGMSILWVRPLQWWAAGVQYFPYNLLDLLCLYGFLRYHANGQRRWAMISVAALASALLFYEKPAYMLVYLVLLRVLLMSEDLHPRAVLTSFWRERAVWASYILVIAIWGAGYIHSQAFSTHGAVRAQQYLTYFRIFWLQTLVPSLASVTIPASKLDGLQVFFVVVSQVVVLACIGISLWRKRAAWRAWAFLGSIILLAGMLVARSRVPIFGVDIANDPRYLIDYSWLVPLTLCAAFAPGNVLRPLDPDRSERFKLPSGRMLAPLITVLLLVYVVGATASAIQLEKIWAGPQARDWEKRVRGGIARLTGLGPRPMVADNVTPFEVLSEWIAPYNRLDRVLPMYVGPIQIDGPLDAPLVRIANDGTVHRARMIAVGGTSTVLDLATKHQLDVGPGGRTVHQGGDLCVVASGAPVSVGRQVVGARGGTGTPFYVRLTYRVWHPAGLSVFTDTGAGYPPAPEHGIELSPRASSSIAWLGAGVPRQVELEVPPLTTVCMSRFEIVTLGDIS